MAEVKDEPRVVCEQRRQEEPLTLQRAGQHSARRVWPEIMSLPEVPRQRKVPL